MTPEIQKLTAAIGSLSSRLSSAESTAAQALQTAKSANTLANSVSVKATQLVADVDALKSSPLPADLVERFDKLSADFQEVIAAISAVSPAPVPTPVPVEDPPIPDPEEGPATIEWGPHYMLSDLPDNEVGQARVVEDVKFMIDAKQTYAFAFTDGGISKEFNPNEGEMYGRRMKWFLNAAYAAGLAVIPQMQSGSAGQWSDFVARVTTHPAILRNNGKPVVAVWNWKQGMNEVIAEARQHAPGAIEVWACVDWWEVMGPNRPAGPLHDDQQHWDKLDVLLQEQHEIDGLLQFAAGRDFDNLEITADMLIEQNENLVRFCRAAGKEPIPGIAFFYHDKVLTNTDALRVLDNMRSLGTKYGTFATANDWGESGVNKAQFLPLHELIKAHLLLG